MRKGIYLLVGVLAVFGMLAGCAPEAAPAPDEEAPAAPAGVIEWKCQSTFGMGSWDYICGEDVCKRIDQMTGGRLIVTPLLAPGTIVPAFEQLDAVEKGMIDMGESWCGYWVGKDSAFTLFASAAGGPYGMDTFDHMGWMFYGGGYELWKDLFKTVGYNNIVPFIAKGEFPEPLGWFPEQLTCADDIVGYKMRVAGLAAEVFKEAGVSVVTVSGGEILPLLEKGTLDASEYSDPHSDMRLGIADVLKHYHAPGIHQPTGYVEMLINRDSWEALPDDLKCIVELCCHEMLIKNTVHEYVLGQAALVELETDYGVELHESPPDLLLKLLEAWDVVAAREVAANPNFKEIYASMEEYASRIVPYRRQFFPEYSLAADYYWPK